MAFITRSETALMPVASASKGTRIGGNDWGLDFSIHNVSSATPSLPPTINRNCRFTMNILITAGNTMTLVDKVRCITNVFSGRTGAGIATYAASRGHSVWLLTSKPEVVEQPAPERLFVESYTTFNDLEAAMHRALLGTEFDAVIHCAAVSDYDCAGVFAPSTETRFDPSQRVWESTSTEKPTLLDRRAGKIKSNEPELWLRLVQTPKLVDKIRDPWGFRGILVKFKLEVDISEQQLLEVAEASRLDSAADYMVANTFDARNDWAYFGPLDGEYARIKRTDLPQRLIAEIEGRVHQERSTQI